MADSLKTKKGNLMLNISVWIKVNMDKTVTKFWNDAKGNMSMSGRREWRKMNRLVKRILR